MSFESPLAQPPRKCILVVDDDEDSREAIAAMLSPSYCVRFAVDGMDGYTQAHDEPPPDLIIADVSMPDIDGFTMVQRIRESDGLRRVPVIFFTGQMAPESVIAGLHIGTFAYISKTSAPSILENKVKRALWR